MKFKAIAFGETPSVGGVDGLDRFGVTAGAEPRKPQVELQATGIHARLKVGKYDTCNGHAARRTLESPSQCVAVTADICPSLYHSRGRIVLDHGWVAAVTPIPTHDNSVPHSPELAHNFL